MELEHSNRHIDRGTILGNFASEAMVVCPKCASAALVTAVWWSEFHYIPQAAKVVCLSCPYATTMEEAGWLGPAIGIAKERCPGCGFKWLMGTVWRKSVNARGRDLLGVTCPQCHRFDRVDIQWRVRRAGAATDSVFGLPLWLQSPCCGAILWAYNAEHLRVLHGYVAAGLRERTGVRQWSMFARLPKWMSAHKNRKRVLAAIERLSEKIPPRLSSASTKTTADPSMRSG